MTSFQPQLWTEQVGSAVAFYERAFGARVLHRVGEGDDIVVQLAIGDAAFWVSKADITLKRFSPAGLSGTTGRTLLVIDDPEALVAAAIEAGALLMSPVQNEHDWQLGRIVDPFGFEWEVGRPVDEWPPL